MIKKIMLFVIIFSATSLFANKQDVFISFDVQHVDVVDVLRMIAKKTHDNLIINPSIHADVTLHLTHVSAKKTLAVLLRSYHLAKVSLGGDVWYITPRQEWMQATEEEKKFQNEMESVAPLVTQLFQIHYAKASELAHLLQENANALLSRRGHVCTDARTNILCIQDIPERLYQLQQVIKKMDVPVKQVVIETRLANVDSDFERDLGIHLAVTQSVNASSEDAGLPKSQYGLLVASLPGGGWLDVQLSALEEQGKAELISSPRLFTANQQTAMIESGEEIPYQEESASGGTIVRFKKAVLSLKVTPEVLPGNKILLQLQVNQDKPSKLLIHGNPAINTREMSTNVMLKNGQTVVLGGIAESDVEHATQSIPYLSHIPLLNLLTELHEIRIKKRELLIFVTPRVVPG